MTASTLYFGPPVRAGDFQRIQRRMALDFCKWDSQVGDVSTLFPQPLLISPGTWQELKQVAQNLSQELASAENELLHRPDLYPALGLPVELRAAFDQAGQKPTRCAVRTLRLDFHYTTEGWRISEVNSDVPGGYTEASKFTQLMCEQYAGAKTCGDPAVEWGKAMTSGLGEGGLVALLSAPGFLEDQQVTAFLGCQLHERGVKSILLHHPSQLSWKGGRAMAFSKGMQVHVDSIVRFYQGEWLAKLPASCGWKWLFFGGSTPVTNPAPAVLTESKRLALAWDGLSSKMNTWRRLLPECRDPRHRDWETEDQWVVKAAFSNNGDDVYLREAFEHEAWIRFCRSVEKRPEGWVVQRRFETVPIASESGAIYPCIGVYTVNGQSAGVYARASVKRVTDYGAMDVALLIDEETDVQQG